MSIVNNTSNVVNLSTSNDNNVNILLLLLLNLTLSYFKPNFEYKRSGKSYNPVKN